jgi:hypothetical protein
MTWSTAAEPVMDIESSAATGEEEVPGVVGGVRRRSVEVIGGGGREERTEVKRERSRPGWDMARARRMAFR